MKRKKWLLPLCIVVVVVLCVILWLVSGLDISSGHCLMADNDSCFLVLDNRPVKLNYKKETNFQTGDKLLVVHQSAFAESYPEQTRAYLILKTGSGSVDDVPQAAKDVLIEVGMLNKRILTAAEITAVQISLQDSAEAHHNTDLAKTVESTDPELIALLLALRDGLNPKNVNRPMDFPRYVATFLSEDGCANHWRLDQFGVTGGNHLGIGNHWLDSSAPYEAVTALFDSLS